MTGFTIKLHHLKKQHFIEQTVLCVRPQEVWLLTRERELKEDLRRQRDKEIELAIFTLEEETSKDKEECERAADNRCVCVRVCARSYNQIHRASIMFTPVWMRRCEFIRYRC